MPVPPVPADADFIVTCYEVLLGRELESLEVVRDRQGWERIAVLRSIVGSPEFAACVLPGLETGFPFPDGRYAGRPSLRQRLWTADALGLDAQASARVMASDSWRNLLLGLVSDGAFVEAVGWPQLW